MMEIPNNNKTLKEEIKLLKAVKSIYITRQIFSFLYENRKLILISHNKKYQNKLEINIENYKTISGKYKIAEKNGKGKEYSLIANRLIFEGEYKNGKKNGKGKEYYINGKLKFEGEYLNGKKISGKGYDDNGFMFLLIEKNGEEKKYYCKDKLKFEGEFYNGRKWNGIGYDYEGVKAFELKNGKGFVKEYHNGDGQLIFVGEYLNGEKK